jgi:hypothetical protein
VVHEERSLCRVNDTRCRQEIAHLTKNCPLEIVDIVKRFAAQKDCSNAFSEILVEVYDLYCRATNIGWKKPYYGRYDDAEDSDREVSKRAPMFLGFLFYQ